MKIDSIILRYMKDLKISNIPKRVRSQKQSRILEAELLKRWEKWYKPFGKSFKTFEKDIRKTYSKSKI